MIITRKELENYGFTEKADQRWTLDANSFEFEYQSGDMRMGMEEGNGWHDVKDVDEFLTLYKILS